MTIKSRKEINSLKSNGLTTKNIDLLSKHAKVSDLALFQVWCRLLGFYFNNSESLCCYIYNKY